MCEQMTLKDPAFVFIDPLNFSLLIAQVLYIEYILVSTIPLLYMWISCVLFVTKKDQIHLWPI